MYETQITQPARLYVQVRCKKKGAPLPRAAGPVPQNPYFPRGFRNSKGPRARGPEGVHEKNPAAS